MTLLQIGANRREEDGMTCDVFINPATERTYIVVRHKDLGGYVPARSEMDTDGKPVNFHPLDAPRESGMVQRFETLEEAIAALTTYDDALPPPPSTPAHRARQWTRHRGPVDTAAPTPSSTLRFVTNTKKGATAGEGAFVTVDLTAHPAAPRPPAAPRQVMDLVYWDITEEEWGAPNGPAVGAQFAANPKFTIYATSLEQVVSWLAWMIDHVEGSEAERTLAGAATGRMDFNALGWDVSTDARGHEVWLGHRTAFPGLMLVAENHRALGKMMALFVSGAVKRMMSERQQLAN